MEQKTLFKKNFAWNSLGIGFNSLSSLFFLIIITRVIGVYEAGLFTITFSMALVLNTIALYAGRLFQVTDTQYVVRDREYIVNRAISCLAMLLVALLLVLIQGYSMERALILLSLCLFRVLESFADVYYGILQRQEKLYISGISLTVKATVGILVFLFASMFTNSILWACFSLVLVNLLVLVCYDIRQCKVYVKDKSPLLFKNVFSVFKDGFFIFANAFLALYILNAPRFAIDNHLSYDMQAIFGYIMMPATVIVLFTQFILMPFMNQIRVTYEFQNKRKLQNIIFKIGALILAFGVLACVLAYLLGPEVLGFIYGVDLYAQRLHLVLILVGNIFYAISYVLLILLTTMRKTWIQFIIFAITLILAYFISDYLVVSRQIEGASMAVLITLGVQFVLYVLVATIYMVRFPPA